MKIGFVLPKSRSRSWWTAVGASALIGTASLTSPAWAQSEATVQRSAKGLPGAQIRIGLYLNVKDDCTSGPLPTIRLVTPAANGIVTIKRGKVSATNYKKCLALEVPGFIAFYKSKADFAGIDSATIEVKYPAGRTEIQHIKITVGDGKGGQKI